MVLSEFNHPGQIIHGSTKTGCSRWCIHAGAGGVALRTDGSKGTSRGVGSRWTAACIAWACRPDKEAPPALEGPARGARQVLRPDFPFCSRGRVRQCSEQPAAGDVFSDLSDRPEIRCLQHGEFRGPGCGLPESRFDMVRPGLMLYGVTPFREDSWRRDGAPGSSSGDAFFQ